MTAVPAAPRMGAADALSLLLLSVLWGGSFLFVGVAVREVPPLTLVAVRVAVAALTLHLVLRAAGLGFPAGRTALFAFLGMGLLNNAIPFTLLAWGQAQIASGLASILNATTPLFTVLVAHAATADERLTPLRLAGVAAGLLGVAVMMGGAGELAGDVPAQLACLVAALSYGCAGVFGRRLRRLGVQPLVSAAGQVTASTLLMVPLALLADRPWTLAAPSGGALAALLLLATVSTAFAYLLYFRILGGAGATNVSLVTLLVPVSAVMLGWLVLGERLEPRHLAGLALIATGLAAIDGRLPALLWRRARPSARPGRGEERA